MNVVYAGGHVKSLGREIFDEYMAFAAGVTSAPDKNLPMASPVVHYMKNGALVSR